MYMPPVPAQWPAPDDLRAIEELTQQAREHFNDFVEDIYEELRTFGPVEDLQVCDNTGAHLVGNVYVKFEFEDDAEKATKALTGRFYGGRLLVPEYSPVTDFRESRCRQYDINECQRGGQCNFMHLKELDSDLERKLFGRRSRRSRSERHEKRDRHDRGDRDDSDRRRERRERSRSRSRRSRSRSRSSERHRKRRERSRDRDDDRDRHRDRDRDNKDRDRERDRDRDRDSKRSRHSTDERSERREEPPAPADPAPALAPAPYAAAADQPEA
jgi:splicing factor U2AF subunit